MREILFFKLTEDAILPTRAHDTDAGIDLYANESVFIPLGHTVKISTGIAGRIHPGYVGLVKERSSLGSKGLSVRAGVIDALYSGEWTVVMTNLTCEEDGIDRSIGTTNDMWSYQSLGYNIKKNDKIAQVLIQKIETPEIKETTHMWASLRGNAGWGSSGK